MNNAHEHGGWTISEVERLDRIAAARHPALLLQRERRAGYCKTSGQHVGKKNL